MGNITRVLLQETSDGIGETLALELLEKGYTVFGCNRRQLNIDYPSFLPIIMDITNEESVKKGLEEV